MSSLVIPLFAEYAEASRLRYPHPSDAKHKSACKALVAAAVRSNPAGADILLPLPPPSASADRQKRESDAAQARPAAESASHSLRRALLMPLVNPGSLYRCGKRT